MELFLQIMTNIFCIFCATVRHRILFNIFISQTCDVMQIVVDS